MATKIICDMCGDDCGFPAYRFIATMSEISEIGNLPQSMNVSKPISDLCKECSGKVATILNDMDLPSAAIIQT